MSNSFVHVELATGDIAKAKDFYGKLFSWKLQDVDMGPGGTYTMVDVQDEDGVGGGMMQHPMPGTPAGWLAYVSVDDVKASTEKAKSLGASVMRDVTEIPGMGFLSIIVDPTGAMLGLWQGTRG